MIHAADFLQDLALVLCVAAVTTILFHLIKQPPILGYLLAGLLLGPHVSLFPFYPHESTVRTLAELGVILVMFSIGLEFSLQKFVQVLPTAGLTNLIELSSIIWVGYTLGRLMGWSPLESLFTGAIVSLASTMIGSKALLDQRADPKLTRVVFGIMVVQDMVSVLMLAVLTPLAQGANLSFSGLLMTSGGLLGFLGILLGAGYLLVPRLIRYVVSLRSPETLLVTSVGICFAMALLAQLGGYSVALGAFLAGMLVAESGATNTIERLIHPLKDMFAAVFFVAVGMLVDPSTLKEYWGAVTLLTLVVIGGQTVSVSVGAFLSGRPLKTALQAAMALTQIGEFSFIIAQIGVSHGAVRGFLYDVTVAVSVVTAFTTPLLIKASEPFSRLVDSRLPKPLQTFSSLYGSWLEELRSGKSEQTLARRAWRLVIFLLVDTFSLVVIVITTSATVSKWLPRLREVIHLPPFWSVVLLVGAGILLAMPFLLGILNCAKTLGGLIATTAIPAVLEGQLDLGQAPRRVLTLALQLGIVFAVGLPFLALTQPFLPFGYSPVLLILIVVVLGVVFWKSALDLQGHVQAGAQMVAEALSSHAPRSQDAFLEQVNTVVPGIGAPTSVKVEAGFFASGRSLGELNLRTKTGASIIAISRGTERVLMPSGKETLGQGDTLVLVGTHEAVAQARDLLKSGLF
ncbi:MAG TPA: cation:proton antiporter [bacterium]|nr:cation:proton antiporter [bacterium]